MNFPSSTLWARTIRSATIHAAAVLACACLVLAGGARAEEPRIYTPAPGADSDVNGDGLPDVQNILNRIDELATVGVKFDDEDQCGNVPERRADGKYLMACIDLVNVTYRAAGYDIPSAMSGGKLIGATTDPKKVGHGNFRQIVTVLDWIKRNPNFHFYATPEINLVANKRWRPDVPFKIGDMVFVHYDDATDRHSGIVTGVDEATGRPTHITNCSIYNENQGLHRATVDEFFALKCRMLTGHARPASWDGGSIVDPVQLRPMDGPSESARRPTRPIHTASQASVPPVARPARAVRRRTARRRDQRAYME